MIGGSLKQSRDDTNEADIHQPANPLAAFCMLLIAAWLTTPAFGAESGSDGLSGGQTDWRDQDDVRAALLDGRLSAKIRYRFEHVSQGGLGRDANAQTVSTRLGYATGPLFGFRAMVEGENIAHIGTARFNDTVNRKTQFPTVADPDHTGLNQYWIASSHLPATDIKAGRQKIAFDNHRFVGNVGFRQNEQTFDALRISTGPLPDLSIDYAYLFLVDRIFGEDSAVGDFETDSHLIQAAQRISGIGLLSSYAYLLDFDEAPGLSSKTFGARLKGRRQLAERWWALYAAEFAWQSDYANNHNNDSFAYYFIEPAVSYRVTSAAVGYEVLAGNGRRAFQTPLATLHAFQGMADIFLTTPGDGIEDLYLRLRHALTGSHWLAGTRLSATLHHFAAEQGGTHYGDEVDLEVSYPLHDRVSLDLKGAIYDAAGFGRDTEKVWLSVSFTY